MFLTVIPSAINLSYTSSGLAVEDVLDVTAGSPVSVTCSVVGSKPTAEIFWMFKGIKLSPDGTQDNITNELDQRLTDSTSSVTLTGISLDHHGALLSCRAVIPPDSIETMVTVTIDVKGRPIHRKFNVRNMFYVLLLHIPFF